MKHPSILWNRKKVRRTLEHTDTYFLGLLYLFSLNIHSEAFLPKKRDEANWVQIVGEAGCVSFNGYIHTKEINPSHLFSVIAES